MNRVDNKSSLYAGLVFLIWPLLSVISAFFNYKSPWSKNILWAFVAFYGFTFAFGVESEGSDIHSYVNQYQSLHGQTFTVTEAVQYYRESGEVDILRTFLAILLSRFSDHPAVLTLVYGIIFGFFFSRNMFYLLKHLEGKLQPVTILLFICFFLVIPIWNMNGFRMWTAAHIFLYGLLPYLFEGEKKGLLISTLAILVHYSFLIPVAILYTYLLLGNRLVLYFCFFVVTFFISEINLESFNQYIEAYAPEIIQERSSSYRTEAQVEQYREGGPERDRQWYAVWYRIALSWSVMGFLVILFINGRTFFEENKYWLNLYCFTLFFYGIANIFSSLPSGGRFISIALMCALSIIILYIQNQPHKKVMKRFIIAAIPALILYIVVAVRIGLYSMSATSILGNPIIAAFTIGENISLNDVLRMII